MRTVTARPAEEILASKVSTIRETAEEEITSIHRGFDFCESPLEQVFFLEYLSVYDAEPTWTESGNPVFTHKLDAGDLTGRTKEYYVFLELQAEIITTLQKKYRADFLITVRGWFGMSDGWREVDRVVVEIDGHDFHERTKQQAAGDRSRDRALTSDGYTVVRFTGSEIYANPVAAIFELSPLITRNCV